MKPKTWDTYNMTEIEKKFFNLLSQIRENTEDKDMEDMKETADAILTTLVEIKMEIVTTNELLQKLGRISPS